VSRAAEAVPAMLFGKEDEQVRAVVHGVWILVLGGRTFGLLKAHHGVVQRTQESAGGRGRSVERSIGLDAARRPIGLIGPIRPISGAPFRTGQVGKEPWGGTSRPAGSGMSVPQVPTHCRIPEQFPPHLCFWAREDYAVRRRLRSYGYDVSSA